MKGGGNIKKYFFKKIKLFVFTISGFIMQKLCIASLLFLSSMVSLISAMEEDSFIKIKRSSLMAPQNLGNIELFHDHDGFHVVINDDERHNLKSYFVDPLLRKVDKKTLKKFQKVGYLSVKQMSNGEFSLTAKARGLGGGPVLAGIFYCATKAIGTGVNDSIGEEVGTGIVNVTTYAITGSEATANVISRTPGLGVSTSTVLVEATAVCMGIIGAIIPSL